MDRYQRCLHKRIHEFYPPDGKLYFQTMDECHCLSLTELYIPLRILIQQGWVSDGGVHVSHHVFGFQCTNCFLLCTHSFQRFISPLILETGSVIWPTLESFCRYSVVSVSVTVFGKILFSPLISGWESMNTNFYRVLGNF